MAMTMRLSDFEEKHTSLHYVAKVDDDLDELSKPRIELNRMSQ